MNFKLEGAMYEFFKRGHGGTYYYHFLGINPETEYKPQRKRTSTSNVFKKKKK